MAEDGITLRGTDFKVSVTEKRATGDYENIQTHAALEGELPAPESEPGPGNPIASPGGTPDDPSRSPESRGRGC